MADLVSGLGSLLGSFLTQGNVNSAIDQGTQNVEALTSMGTAQTLPYNYQGLNFMDPINRNLTGDSAGSANIGQGRINAPDISTPTYGRVGATPNYSFDSATNPDPVNFQDFAKNYNMSEGAKYLMDTASASQDNSAAAKGGLLSGANLRAQTGIAEGIANQDLLQQYGATAAGQQQGWQQNQASNQQTFQQQLAAGNQDLAAQQQQFAQDFGAYGQQLTADQQDFQQRETSYQNLYGQEQLGLQGAIAGAGTLAQGARALGSLAGTQATASATAGASTGGALGSIFSSIAKFFGGG